MRPHSFLYPVCNQSCQAEDKWILDSVEQLLDTVDRVAPGELLADVRWMLANRLARDCTDTLTETFDVPRATGARFFSRSSV